MPRKKKVERKYQIVVMDGYRCIGEMDAAQRVHVGIANPPMSWNQAMFALNRHEAAAAMHGYTLDVEPEYNVALDGPEDIFNG